MKFLKVIAACKRFITDFFNPIWKKYFAQIYISFAGSVYNFCYRKPLNFIRYLKTILLTMKACDLNMIPTVYIFNVGIKFHIRCRRSDCYRIPAGSCRNANSGYCECQG